MTSEEATVKAIEAIEMAQNAASESRPDDARAFVIIAAEWRFLASDLRRDGATQARNAAQQR